MTQPTPQPITLILSAIARARGRLTASARLLDQGYASEAAQELDRARALLFSAAGVLAAERGTVETTKEAAARLLQPILADQADAARRRRSS